MKKKKKKKNKSSVKLKNKLMDQVMDIFNNNPSHSYNYKQVSSLLNVNSKGKRKMVMDVLAELERSEYLKEVKKGKYQVSLESSIVEGRIEFTAKGTGYLISNDIQQEVFIANRNLNHALPGDRVKVRLYAHHRNKTLEGEVLQILERGKTQFVGKLSVSSNFAFLVTASRNVPFDIFIPIKKLKGAKDGQKAIARIIDWPGQVNNPFGEIVEVLGDSGDNETEMHAILAEYDLPHAFPDTVEQAAEKIPEAIPQEEYKKRRDFRDVPTFTIDPEDAKDFDDALSLRKLKDGKWEVGVHIADVTHYVQPDTILDKEAYDRGTSVYLVDRVVPMLPERLSNGVCSLRPNEDKLCFSAVFKVDDQANVHDQWFGRTVINSDRRFNYQEAQDIIDGGEGDLKQEVLTLNGLARKLREERFQAGSIAFERVEVKFLLDELGSPTGVYFKEHGEANELIEEFMLLANRKVAEFIGNVPKNKTPKTFVYRIHDKPDSEKLETFADFVEKFGYTLNMKNNRAMTSSINKLLEEVEGKKEQNVVETLAIRSMAKAEYSTRNIGHYGLAFDYYSHFTSPIRRYPDMMVHRLLARYLDGGDSANEKKYGSMCQASSDMEKLAEDAERASIKYKQVEFLKDRLGEEFEGIISGVMEWGVFVELNDTKCEGLVHIRDLDDDFYIYDERNYCIIGQSKGKKYQLGDPVKVKLVRTDLEKKQIDFLMLEKK
ncbi:MAG TPA: ribonuclease R [Bacteroidales bacterium]|nr:ribonuclease R [Bacteroidales bacterium]